MSEWISVKDRLPEEGRHLACRRLTFGGKAPVFTTIMVVNYFGEGSEILKDDYEILTDSPKPGWYIFDYEYQGYYNVKDVTHWMPLPEPPKED